MNPFNVLFFLVFLLWSMQTTVADVACAYVGTDEELSPECWSALKDLCDKIVPEFDGGAMLSSSKKGDQSNDGGRALNTPCEECPSWPQQWQG